MKTTLEIINTAFTDLKPTVSFSGGSDSMVLLNIVCEAGYKPPLIYADSQMEYDNNLEFIKKIATQYGLELHVARAPITPQEQWQKTGYPMLGKMAARLWMQKHRKEKSLGFKIDVSSCCRKMKIQPARRKVIEIGCNASLTGQKGNHDDRLRGLRAIKDGAVKYLKQDKITQVNPLTHWTESMIRRYTRNHNLPINPNKADGAITIGCMYCGGGAQFDNSGFRVLRKTRPKEWRKMIGEYGFGEIILAIKYNQPLTIIREAISSLGGIEVLMDRKPYIFDFLRETPLPGYSR